MENENDVDALLPLPPATFHILVALAEERPARLRHHPGRRRAHRRRAEAQRGHALSIDPAHARAGPDRRDPRRVPRPARTTSGGATTGSRRSGARSRRRRRGGWRRWCGWRARRVSRRARPDRMKTMSRPSLARLLLLLYPASFRSEYGDEMWRVFARGAATMPPARSASRATLAGRDRRCAVNARRGCTGDIFRQDSRLRAAHAAARARLHRTAMLVVGARHRRQRGGVFGHRLSCCSARCRSPMRRGSSRCGSARRRLGPAWSCRRPTIATGRGRHGRSRHRRLRPTLSANLVGHGEPVRVDGAARHRRSVLPLLGVQPLIGRGFTADDDRDGAPGTVLLSASAVADARSAAIAASLGQQRARSTASRSPSSA